MLKIFFCLFLILARKFFFCLFLILARKFFFCLFLILARKFFLQFFCARNVFNLHGQIIKMNFDHSLQNFSAHGLFVFVPLLLISVVSDVCQLSSDILFL